MAPEFTPELLDLVKRIEGFRAKPYLCPAGYPTIGYGHRIPSLNHPPITESEAEQLLRVDLSWAQRAALQLAPNLATEPRRLAALTDLAYNVGRDALDGADANDLRDDAGVVQCLRARDWPGAAVRFRRWNKAKVKGVLTPLPGLTARRDEAARWIVEG